MQLQNDMTRYEQEYASTGQKMVQIGEQANIVLQQRAECVQDYEAATGKLVKKSGQLEKRAAWADAKKKKLEGAAAGKAKPAGIGDGKFPSFVSYVPFDLEAEKKRVLESFSIGVKE